MPLTVPVGKPGDLIPDDPCGNDYSQSRKSSSGQAHQRELLTMQIPRPHPRLDKHLSYRGVWEYSHPSQCPCCVYSCIVWGIMRRKNVLDMYRYDFFRILLTCLACRVQNAVHRKGQFSKAPRVIVTQPLPLLELETCRPSHCGDI